MFYYFWDFFLPMHGFIRNCTCIYFWENLPLTLYEILNITSNQEIKNLINAIEDKQINEGWLLNDAKWNLKIKKLENFEGFDGKHFFAWNKSFLTRVVSTFFTYFIILVQFKDASPEEPPANWKYLVPTY